MIRKFLLIIPLLAIIGCSSTDIEKLADDSKEAKAIKYIQDVVDGNFEEIKEALEPSLKPGLTDEVFQNMRNLLGTENPNEKRLIGYEAHSFNGEPTRYNLSYQYGYKDRWVLVNVAFRTLANGKDEIYGLNVYNPMDRPLQEVHRFTLAEKGITHYLFLAGCTLVPLSILFTLIVAIRTKFKKRKWLWIMFILFGICQASLNWTTGQIGFNPLSFQIFGSSVLTASVYAPWILSFSLPIGAALFWIKREKLKCTEVQQDVTPNA